MHPLFLLFHRLSQLLVERRSLSGAGDSAPGLSLDRRQPRRGRGRAPRRSGRSLPPLSLPHHHELHPHLPQEPEPRQGHRRDQEADARAALRRERLSAIATCIRCRLHFRHARATARTSTPRPLQFSLLDAGQSHSARLLPFSPPSFPRKRESSAPKPVTRPWIPACAGMTALSMATIPHLIRGGGGGSHRKSLHDV